MTAPAARALCIRCLRPGVVCYCAHLPCLPTRTRVLVLQHPRERGVGIGTARMAHLSLPGSLLCVGVDFAADPVVAAALAGSAATYLLFPGERGAEARDVRQLAGQRPVTLVVVDGTWTQARKLVKRNPALAALPRLAFVPRRPSEYRIRREPADFCVSTIEALAEVLNVLEPEAGPFDALLDPFRAMVDRQEWFATEVRSNRHQLNRRRRGSRAARREARPTLAARLAADWQRLVCIQGEANAWPARMPERPQPDIVHFVACRPATGEIYQTLVEPRQPLAPQTPHHLEVPAARLLAGVSVEEWRRSWRAFSRPGDVLVEWGSFHANLATADGVLPPPPPLDLRSALAQSLRQPGGTLEECLERLGAPVRSLGLEGRAGRRLAELLALVGALCRG